MLQLLKNISGSALTYKISYFRKTKLRVPFGNMQEATDQCCNSHSQAKTAKKQ